MATTSSRASKNEANAPSMQPRLTSSGRFSPTMPMEKVRSPLSPISTKL